MSEFENKFGGNTKWAQPVETIPGELREMLTKEEQRDYSEADPKIPNAIQNIGILGAVGIGLVTRDVTLAAGTYFLGRLLSSYVRSSFNEIRQEILKKALIRKDGGPSV